MAPDERGDPEGGEGRALVTTVHAMRPASSLLARAAIQAAASRCPQRVPCGRILGAAGRGQLYAEQMSIGSLIAKTGASAVVKKLESMLPGARTNELFGQMAQEAAFECEGFLKKMVERLGGDPDAAIARLVNSVTDEEAAAMTGRLIREAVFSATRDRRRLMAAAMAGTLSPDFEVEHKSRITRSIAQLEPSDVVLLRSISQGNPFPFGAGTIQETQGRERNREVSLAALAAAGCVVEVVVEPARTHERTGAHRPERTAHRLTHLGSMTLKFITDWEPATTPPSSHTSDRR